MFIPQDLTNWMSSVDPDRHAGFAVVVRVLMRALLAVRLGRMIVSRRLVPAGSGLGPAAAVCVTAAVLVLESLALRHTSA
jgi:homoserine kinase